MTPFRQEFENAYKIQWMNRVLEPPTHIEVALWATKWMAEKGADEHANIDETKDAMLATIKYRDRIRQLAKELE